jgi:hypothetical protein
MQALCDIEQAFWSKVWRCAHRTPCRKCCWPWRAVDLHVNWKCIWQQHAVFALDEPGSKRWIPAHRFAYECRGGRLLFRGLTVHICHQCDFAPCCNPWHLAPGAASDNHKEGRRSRRAIRLPDGRRWTYEEACGRQAAFYEALQYQRVYAGEIPQQFTSTAHFLDAPWSTSWPGERRLPLPRLARHGKRLPTLALARPICAVVEYGSLPDS